MRRHYVDFVSSFECTAVGVNAMQNQNKFLHVIPYRVSEAEDIEQARECAAQLRATDPTKRSLLEHVYVEELLPALDALLVYYIYYL